MPARPARRACRRAVGGEFLVRAVARSGRSRVLRGGSPFAGAWGRPPISFFSRARRAQEILQQPWPNFTCIPLYEHARLKRVYFIYIYNK